MRTIKNRLAKLESDLGTKEPTLIVIIRKVTPRDQWRLPIDNCPPGIRIEWIDPEDPNIHQSSQIRQGNTLAYLKNKVFKNKK